MHWAWSTMSCQPPNCCQPRRIAERICANAHLAVRESLAIARKASELTDEEGWRLTREASVRIMQSEDAHEGPQAFAEKRAPRWRGR